MGDIVGKFTDAIGITNNKQTERAAQSIRQEADRAAGFQQQALDYLKQTQAPVLEAQKAGLGRLGEMANKGVNPYQLKTEGQLLAGIENSPLYQSIMSGLGDAEESILRNQSATGGFRSGGTQQNLGRLATQTKTNALLNAFQNRQQQDINQAGFNQQAFQNQLGLENTIQGMPNYVGNVANLTTGIGNTLAQGNVAAAQARLQGSQANQQGLLGLAGLGLKAFSDRRLKENLQSAGKENGFNVYTWDWNKEAKEKLGLTGSGRGVIADEVKRIKPEAVTSLSGYDTVDYEMIGVKHG